MVSILNSNRQSGRRSRNVTGNGYCGIGMTVLVTAVWGGMLAVSHIMEKHAVKSAATLPPAK